MSYAFHCIKITKQLALCYDVFICNKLPKSILKLDVDLQDVPKLMQVYTRKSICIAKQNKCKLSASGKTIVDHVA